MDIISELNAAEVERISAIRTFPAFSPGDTLRVKRPRHGRYAHPRPGL